ncbi:MAG TPA: DinB family protein [Candidatus Acidoferrales bacterium]|nr:DinB family protein [Candidatus Acidoferrales bacterium]
MRLLSIALFAAGFAAAQTPANPLVATSQAIYGIAKNNIQRSADKIPDELWNFQPTREVRTVAQLFAHIADGQYEFCGVAAEGKVVSKDIEKTAKGKADIMAALKDSFAYCDAAYAKMTDASAAELTTFFGRRITKLGAMDFNIAHTMEHYGNLVTYMRIKNIVPPSSERQQ